MIGTSAGRCARYILVEETGGAFVPDIAAQLRFDGGEVTERLADLPPGVVPDALVIDLVTPERQLPFRSVSDGDLRNLLGRQLYALVTAVQAAVPRMTAGGAILLIVPKAHLGVWGGVHIAASAAACVAMARSMALELAPLGIRVNTVATGQPGEAWDTPEARAEIAATVAWLAGGDSGQITGETILADRGASLRMAQARRR